MSIQEQEIQLEQALENNLAAIEGGKYGACFGSGLAAIDAVVKMLKPGDEVISTNDFMVVRTEYFTTIFEKYNIKVSFCKYVRYPKY